MPRTDRLSDLDAVWLGNGCELARRMAAVSVEIRDRGDASSESAADLLDEVLACEYDPTRPNRPSLGDLEV